MTMLKKDFDWMSYISSREFYFLSQFLCSCQNFVADMLHTVVVERGMISSALVESRKTIVYMGGTFHAHVRHPMYYWRANLARSKLYLKRIIFCMMLELRELIGYPFFYLLDTSRLERETVRPA